MAWPANFFVDDVLLLASSSDGLQMELDICTNWVNEFVLTWAPAKSRVIMPQDTREVFNLGESEVERKEVAPYLGVDISLHGVEESGTQKRIRKSKPGLLN